MSAIDNLVQAMIRMEGSMLPESVNMQMVRKFGLWNMGHLIWAGQRGAVPVRLCPTCRDWAGWPTQQASIDGMKRQIMLDAGRGMTLGAFIEKYAPKKENNTAAYIANVASWTGYPVHARLSDILGGNPLPYGSDTYLAQAGADTPGGSLVWAGQGAGGIDLSLDSGGPSLTSLLAMAGVGLVLIAAAGGGSDRG